MTKEPVPFASAAETMEQDNRLRPPSTSPAGIGNALAELLLFIGGSLGLCVVFWLWRGVEAAQQYLAGYLVELGMSADNALIFLLVFDRFEVPAPLRRRALGWGLAGAVVLRGAALWGGFALLSRFSFLLTLLGGLLVAAGLRMLSCAGRDTAGGMLARVERAMFRLRISRDFHGGRLFAVECGRRVATLFLAVVIVVELTDLAFAVDSLPAVLAVTKDTLVAWASNVAAVLALRSLALGLAPVLGKLRRLHKGLAVILVFAGAKMLAERWAEVPTAATLAAIGGVLLVSLMPMRQTGER